jgi:hypothetical protein
LAALRALIAASVLTAISGGMVAAAPPATGEPQVHGGGTVWITDFITTVDVVDTRACAFPVHVTGVQHHQTRGYYRVPVTLDDVVTQRALLQQRSGAHEIRSETTFVNTLSGSMATVEGVWTINRTDIDASDLVIDADGFVTGTLKATDKVSGNFGPLMVKGEGIVLPDMGRVVIQHTSIYVDSRRVGRVDALIAEYGNLTHWGLRDACPYLT